MRQGHAVESVSGRSGDGLSWPYGKLTAWIELYKWYGNVLSGKKFNDEWDEEEGTVNGGSGGQDSMISQMLMN